MYFGVMTVYLCYCVRVVFDCRFRSDRRECLGFAVVVSTDEKIRNLPFPSTFDISTAVLINPVALGISTLFNIENTTLVKSSNICVYSWEILSRSERCVGVDDCPVSYIVQLQVFRSPLLLFPTFFPSIFSIKNCYLDFINMYLR